MFRMSVPDVFGKEPFLEFLSGFLKPQPRIRIDLLITIWVSTKASGHALTIKPRNLPGYWKSSEVDGRAIDRREYHHFDSPSDSESHLTRFPRAAS